MSRKAIWKTGSSCPGITCLMFKLSTFILFFVGLFHTLQYVHNMNMYGKFRRSVRPQFPMDEVYRDCRYNREIVSALKARLAEKDALLSEQEKTVADLKSKLSEYNITNTELRNTLADLSGEIRSSKMTPVVMSTEHTHAHNTSTREHHSKLLPTPATMPYPEDLKENVERVNRPCCLGLKRMTDILRIYMETTADLRDEVKYYQDLNNNTENKSDQEDKSKRKKELLNCTKRFYTEHKNWTNKMEKHALYQAYYKGFFYESATPNRDIPKQKYKSKTSHRTLDFKLVSRAALNQVSKETKLRKELFTIDDALIRYDELSGAQYKLTFKYNNSRSFLINMIKPYGTHMVYNRVSEHRTKGKELINIIVPITGRTAQLTNFLRDISEAVIKHKENIFLTVVIYGKDPNNKIKATVRDFSKEHNFGNYDVLKKDAPFNRGRALHDGIMRWNGVGNVLVFLCDIDIKFNQPFLDRCRKYTESGKSVYMPVVFSLYNPNIVFGSDEVRLASKALNISENTGTWRPLGYGMVCTYKKDYLRTNGFNLAIKGWGGEDVSLYHRFRKKGLKVIRAPDPDLYHIWHPKICSTKLSRRQYETCIGSMARYEGSQRQLGILLLSRQMANHHVTAQPIRSPRR